MIKFGTSGFRAIIADGFTKENMQKIAMALSKIILKEKSTKPVIVGFDRRFFSDECAVWCTEVLAANKIKVKLFDAPVTTPMAMYGVMSEGLDYGIMITASHNPYKYNGIKVICKGGADCDAETATKICDIANSHQRIKTMDIDEARNKKLVESYENSKDYFKFIQKFVSKGSKENNIKLLFNAMHSSASSYATMLNKIFKLKKFDVINDSVDPYFEHKLPAPEEENLEEFKNQVSKGRYSIGVAVDGDGDRLGIVDENGTYHDNNEIMALCYYYLVKFKNQKGDIVKNVSTSNIIDKLASTLGFTCHEVPVGFKHIHHGMVEFDALLGGESSGGLAMKGSLPSKDSFFSISLVLDAMITIGKPLSKIIQEVKDFCGYISTFIMKAVKVKNRKRLEKALRKKVPNFAYKPISISNVDGTKYLFEGDNWAQIRFSGTEDALRYCLEFTTEIECERNIKAIENFIKQYGN